MRRSDYNGEPYGCRRRPAEDRGTRSAGEGVDATGSGDRYRGPDEPSTALHRTTANIPKQRSKPLDTRRRSGHYDRKHTRSTRVRKAPPFHHPKHRTHLFHLRSHQKPQKTTAPAAVVCHPSPRTFLIGAAHTHRTQVHHPPPARATSPIFRLLSAGSSPCARPRNRSCHGQTPSSRSSRHSSSVRRTRWLRRSVRPARDLRNVSLSWRDEIWRSGCAWRD